MFQFCGKNCSDEYKKINHVMAMCEYCKIEKILKETVRFSGADKSFCSEGKDGRLSYLLKHVLLTVVDDLSCNYVGLFYPLYIITFFVCLCFVQFFLIKFFISFKC